MDQFLGEIRIFAGNFAPQGWAFCNGQLMPIAQNTALFSLLGTTYGGNGKNTYALPDLQGRVPLHSGQGPGLSNYSQGEAVGNETVTLTQANIPVHTHTIIASNDASNQSAPAPGNYFAAAAGGRGHSGPAMYTANTTQNTALAFDALNITGGSSPISNISPTLSLSFIIALQGVFPQRP